jgi:hypothetical protein
MNEKDQYFCSYGEHLGETISWLQKSIKYGRGGSCAHYTPVFGWSRPYPETSGYIVTTLVEAAHHLKRPRLLTEAIGLGNWLIELQHPDGWWPGGLYAGPGRLKPSVFNSAQIVDGMVALAEANGEERWRESARRAALWLARGVNEDGLWDVGNYNRDFNPSYYTQVAWPMLLYWRSNGGDEIRAAAERVLDRIIALRTKYGTVAGWGFYLGKPAFTHTIAYTLRGCVESADILDKWHAYGEPIETALDRLARKAEFGSGRLAGAYQENWRSVDWYSCLTGNVQIALCLLRYEERVKDLRLVNAAAKLVDYVCSKQRLSSGVSAMRGGVAGSFPMWGRYMFMRFPNWAAKYHADALMMLRNRLQMEMSE